jgi:2-dehydropantoate 2-reductase
MSTQNKLRIHVIGAGGIGGLAGSYMTMNGEDVTLVDRWQEHVDALNAYGCTIDGCRGDMHVPVKAITPDQLTGSLELVFIATKSQHTEAAVRQILPYLTPSSVLVSFQNGINEPLIGDLVGIERVIGAVPNYGGALVDPGHLEYVHEGPIQMGELDGRDTLRLRGIASLLEGQTRVEPTDNMWGHLWGKQVYSSRIIFSSLADLPSGGTLENERNQRMAAALDREALQVPQALGIEVAESRHFNPKLYDSLETPADTERILQTIRKHVEGVSSHKKTDGHQYVKRGSGIWWDLVYRKRKSEVEWLTGDLVRQARKLGIPTPLNDKLVEMIYEIERGERELGWHNYDEMAATFDAYDAWLPGGDGTHLDDKH